MIAGDAPNDQKADEALVEAALDALAERFPDVQIMATRISDNGPDDSQNTVTVTRGRGNWNARMGMAHYWIDTQAHLERLRTERENEL